MGKNTIWIIVLSLILLFTGCKQSGEEADGKSSKTEQPSSAISEETSSELSSEEISSELMESQASSEEVSSQTPPSSKEDSSKPQSKQETPSSKIESSSPPSSDPPVSSAPPVSSEEPISSEPSQTGQAANSDYSPSGYAEIENEILRLVNELRTSVGVGTLEKSKLLSDSAYIRSKEMLDTDYFEHTRPDGSSYTTAIDAAGYQWSSVGENIGYCSGYSMEQVANAIFEGWKNSPGHYQNMISEKYTQIGISICADGTKVYATQNFGKPRG